MEEIYNMLKVLRGRVYRVLPLGLSRTCMHALGYRVKGSEVEGMGFEVARFRWA